MLGGLARRVSFVEKKRSEGQPLLAVDSGDLFFNLRGVARQPDRALAKAGLIGQSYRHMGVDAVNIGDEDLSQGIDFLRREASRGLPLISANLVESSTGKPLFPPYIVRSVGGLRFALWGLMPDFSSRVREKAGEGVKIRNPIETAREMVSLLRKKADFVVLLPDLGSTGDVALTRAVPGIHFIMAGHEGRYLGYPQKEGKTYIFQSYMKGMYLGLLRLSAESARLPFRDERAADQIREKIFALERTLQNYLRAKERQTSQNIDSRIQEIQRQKTALQEELMNLQKTSPGGNRLLWNLHALGKNYPEHEETRREIEKTGLVRD